MERTEPTLIPEWLKNSSNSTSVSSPSYSDDLSAPSVSKNNSFVISNGHNHGWHSGSERTSNSFSRWNSGGINSGRFRSYSSSGRNQQDRQSGNSRNGSRDLDKSFFGDNLYLDPSEPEKNSLFSRFGRDGLRKSQSMISEKRGDSWTRKSVADSSGASRKNFDGVLGAKKTMFERDFPSLKADERTIVPDIGRVPSPGLTPAIEHLPISSSASLGEKWTSVLAEVPIFVANNGSALSSSSIFAPSSSSSLGFSATTGFNMAEAVTHGPIRASTPPQLSTEAQRREELAIKQSRQLIPVTPSMPKPLATNSLEKQKIKQLPSSTTRGFPGKVDSSKSANPVKFHVLKSTREKNGVTLTPNNNNKGSSVVPDSSTGNIIHNVDRKPTEKRPTFQAQSRNEFFKLMRKKASMENTTNPISSSSCVTNIFPASDTRTEDSTLTSITRNTEASHKQEDDEQKNATNGETSTPVISDEEEAAFLRSLGWEENDEDDDGITEEEISAFRMNLTKYMESKKPLRFFQGKEMGLLLPFDDSSYKGKGISSDATKLES